MINRICMSVIALCKAVNGGILAIQGTARDLLRYILYVPAA